MQKYTNAYLTYYYSTNKTFPLIIFKGELKLSCSIYYTDDITGDY